MIIEERDKEILQLKKSLKLLSKEEHTDGGSSNDTTQEIVYFFISNPFYQGGDNTPYLIIFKTNTFV